MISTRDPALLSDALGPDPFGYISDASDGRVMVFVLKSGRPRPKSNPPTPEEKIALFDSLFAYVGTYAVEDDRVIHTLDGSWNELWTGTKQTRLLSFKDRRLSIPPRKPLIPWTASCAPTESSSSAPEQ